jgi:hypothetical protein
MNRNLQVSNSAEVQLDLNSSSGGQIFRLFARDSDKNFGLYDATQTATFFRYISNTTPADRILRLMETGGNVGIGVTSPLARLDVNNSLRVRRDSVQYTLLENSGASGGFITGFSSETNKKPLYVQALFNTAGTPSGSTAIIFRTGNSASPLEGMRLTEAGNVGIGTTGPSGKLEVSNGTSNSADGIILQAANANSPRLFFENDTAAEGWSVVNSSGALNFGYGAVPASTSGTSVFRLFSGGAIGQDITSGSYDLWIQGNMSSTASGAGRNLALLGDTINDRLIINHAGEYTGGTLINSELTVSGTINANGGTIQRAGALNIRTTNTTDLTLGANSTTRLTISSGGGATLSGNLQINCIGTCGTTTLSNLLQSDGVTGYFRVSRVTVVNGFLQSGQIFSTAYPNVGSTNDVCRSGFAASSINGASVAGLGSCSS